MIKESKMKRLLRLAGIFLAFLVSLLGAASLLLYILMPKMPKPKRAIHNVSELEAYLQKVVSAKRPPGLSVAVVKNGEVVYAQGFGTVDEAGDMQATEDTVYHWWSMTKIPTAVAVMQLQERGLLDIDDPVREYLPFFKVTFQGVEQPKVTIRQLLNHSAGLSNAVPEIITWLHLEGEPPVNQTELVVKKFADYHELAFPPGEKTQYSNFGYMVLGAVIEAVSAQTYEAYVLENILQPAGMANTGFVYTEAMAEHEATGSQHLADMYTIFIPLLNLNYLIQERTGMRLWFARVYNDQTPPTGLIGPVIDVARFMIAYLNEGGPILQPETAAKMNAVLESLSKPGAAAQGLGWAAYLTADGRRTLTHSGGGPGFATIFRVYPEENLGLVVMGNDTTIDRESLSDILADMDW